MDILLRRVHRPVHSGQLERWLGAEQVAKVSEAMRLWPGPPIGIHGVPGAVYATAGGDFAGVLEAGFETSSLDRAYEIVKRMRRGWRFATRSQQLNTGFASLSDLISEATGGKRYEFQFQKIGNAGVAS